MAQSIRISIPEPCSEKWSAMTQVDTHRAHCKSCDRVLTDFSQMSDTELALWFTHSKGRICGQFSAHQLNRPITIPAREPKKKHWLNVIWLLPLAAFAKPAAAQTTEIIKSKPTISVRTEDGTLIVAPDTTLATVPETIPVSNDTTEYLLIKKTGYDTMPMVGDIAIAINNPTANDYRSIWSKVRLTFSLGGKKSSDEQ